MAGRKKNNGAANTRKLAGEPVFSSALSPAEERVFSETFQYYRDFPPPPADCPPVGAGSSLMRTRENAARAAVSYFCRHCEGTCSRIETVEALATAAALPVRYENWFAEPVSVALGAAFWLLDYFDLNELHEKYLPLLPAEADDETEFQLPNTMDLIHSRELVVRISEVLLKRKTTYRKQFRRLLGLLRRDDAAKLRAAFRDCLLDYFDRYIEVRTRIRPSEETPADVPFSMSPLPSASEFFDTGPDRAASALPSVFEKAARRSPDLYFLLRTPFLIGGTEKKLLADLHYRRMADLILDFTVENPYELCAAYLLLEEEGDLLCELNTLTAAALICAEHHLPWSYESSEGEVMLCEYETPGIYALRYPFTPPNEDERWPGDEIEEDMMLSEAQLFYLITGFVPPRDRRVSPPLTRWFVTQGIPRPKARELAYAALMVSAVADSDSEGAYPFLPPQPEEEEQPLKQAGTPSDTTAEPNTGEQRIAELTRQLKVSRKALHDAEQNAKELQERLLAVERDAMRDRMELSNLRDTLFRMKAGEEPEESPADESIRFPWQTKRRLLVFGGHDTWSKAIKPLLPSVRFFDRESLPDLNAVKAADAVWIQPNALSHKFYYRIIDTARKEGIPVHYFGYASARKCAEQLVSVELEEGG